MLERVPTSTTSIVQPEEASINRACAGAMKIKVHDMEFLDLLKKYAKDLTLQFSETTKLKISECALEFELLLCLAIKMAKNNQIFAVLTIENHRFTAP
jgi:hypothetical protein